MPFPRPDWDCTGAKVMAAGTVALGKPSALAPRQQTGLQEKPQPGNSIFSLHKLPCDYIHFRMENTRAMQAKHSSYRISFISSFN